MKCLILGGTGYIGREVCKRLHSDGHELFFTWHKNKDLAERLTTTLKSSKSYQLDFSIDCKNALNKILDDMSGIDILIQCVGTAGREGIYDDGGGTLQNISLADFENMIRITLNSTFASAQISANHMKEKGGQIIILGSMNGIKPVPTPIHYASAKGALTAMTSALAKELGKDKICVNLIAPGMLEEGLTKNLPEELKNEYLHHCSMNRFGKAEEIADLIQWMVNKNTYLTGQTFLLDGAL